MVNNKNRRKHQKYPNNPDPLSNVRVMGKEGMRMIKDMAFGKFNFYNDGHVFRNIDFLNAIIMEVDKRLLDIGIHIAAIECAYSGSVDPSVLALLHKDKKSRDAYMLVRNTLLAIANTGDTKLLYTLMNKLPDYKYNM